MNTKANLKIVINNAVTFNTDDVAILKGIIKIINSHLGNEVEYIIYGRRPKISKKYYPNLNTKETLYFQATAILRGPILRKLQNSKFFRIANRKRLLQGFSFWQKGNYVMAFFFLTRSEIETIKDYESADLIVSTGGTYLVENYDLEARIVDFITTISLNKDIILFTQSLGPFKKKENIETFKYIFDHSKLILLRDSLSEKSLKNLSVSDDKIFLRADAAFALADMDYIHQLKKQDSLSKTSLHVAISVRYWPHFESIDPQQGYANYIDSVRDLCIFLTRNMDCKITFISTCQGIPEYYLDDSEVANSIYQDLPEDVRQLTSVDRKHHSPEDLLEALKCFDFAVATRMHIAILSMCVGMPVIPIAYEFKTIELFKKMGLDRWVIDIENINSENLTNLVSELKKQLVDIKSKVAVEVEKEFVDAMSSGDLIKSCLNKN